MYFRSVLLHAVLNRRVTYASFACFATRCNMMRPHSIRSLGQKNELNKNKKKKTYNSLFIAICSIVFFSLFLQILAPLDKTASVHLLHMRLYCSFTVLLHCNCYFFLVSIFTVRCSLFNCFLLFRLFHILFHVSSLNVYGSGCGILDVFLMVCISIIEFLLPALRMMVHAFTHATKMTENRITNSNTSEMIKILYSPLLLVA